MLHRISWWEDERKWSQAEKRQTGNKQELFHRDSQAGEQLPREAVQAPSLEVFKAGLDKAMSNLV